MDQLLEHLKTFYHLSIEAQLALKNCFEEITLSKNEFLLKEQKTCRHLYFLQQGALRGFYNVDGKEITHWFGFENDFVTSFHSFTTEQPSIESIQLIEGCILWAISKD